MSKFRKSRGLVFHLRRFLCITLSICIVLMGLPVKSQAESVINIKVDTLRELRTITSTLERITGILEEFKIITPNMREKIAGTLQELKAILSTLEKIMSLLEEFKDITSTLERIMYALEELKTITPTLEKGMDILNNLKTARLTPVKSLEEVMNTLKELKTIKPALEKIRNNLEELKANRGAVTPDLESKIRGNLATLRTITPPLDRKIWNNLAQISAEITPAPTTVTRPAPTPEPTQPPPAPVDSGMGVGGVLLVGGLIAGAVAVAAAAAGGLGTTSTSSGCSSGYVPCGSTGKCCPDSATWHCPEGCYTISKFFFGGKCNDGSSPVQCHPKPSIFNGNLQTLRMPESGLTLLGSNLSLASGFFKTEFGILGACSGDNSMLNTTLGLQVKGEYSRKRGQFIFSPFIQLQHQQNRGLSEFVNDNVYVYTTTLYGMDILYVPYNLTLS
ncbi:MAG: hypothetical protein HY279_06930, partial [Nitrospinae bacterium]|nr:hypothetical protein [Nitrospinota bacterium]